VTVPSTGPAAQHYEPNSAKSWMHAITGMNMNYGTGIGGYSATVGSEESWFASAAEPKGRLRDRLADQLGLTNENTATQFDTSTWYQPQTAEQAAGATGSAGATGAAAPDTSNQPAQHEDHEYGRPNPDQSVMDINKINMDELATRLYDRLRSRLRTELLIDRERAGLLTDFR
jgi:hypothetical protein